MRSPRLSTLSMLLAVALVLTGMPLAAASARPARPAALRHAQLARPLIAADDDFPGVPLPGSDTTLSGTINDSLNDTSGAGANADYDDIFSIGLKEGETIKVSVSSTDTPGIVVDLFGAPESEAIAFSMGPQSSPDTGYPQVLTFTAGTAGMYYLDFYPYIQFTAGSYTATWTITPPPLSMKRLAGANRYATAIAVSKEGWADGSSQNVILATGANFADALAAAPLAGSYDCPILLTQGFTLTSGVRAEIDRLRGGKTANVMIMGSTAAVSKAVEDAVKKDGGVTVKRIAGPNRYATAVEIGKEVKRHETVDLKHAWTGEAFVCNGNNYPDALAAAPIAAKRKMPIVLVMPKSIPASSTTAFSTLGVTKAFVIGGPPAVDDQVMKDLKVTTKTRISGINRCATAATLAAYAVQASWASSGTVGVATGWNFPDALGGGPLIGKMNGVMLLTQKDFLADEAAGYVYSNRSGLKDMRAFGSDAALDDGIFADFIDTMKQ